MTGKIKNQRANQQPEMAVEDGSEVVMGEEAFIKGVADEEEISIEHLTRHQ